MAGTCCVYLDDVFATEEGVLSNFTHQRNTVPGDIGYF